MGSEGGAIRVNSIIFQMGKLKSSHMTNDIIACGAKNRTEKSIFYSRISAFKVLESLCLSFFLIAAVWFLNWLFTVIKLLHLKA